MALEAGTKLGPYEILSLLGAGGMGEVYRAQDINLGREVAVKVLPDKLASDADRLQRFEREARVVAAINHPNIVTIHAILSEDGYRFLAMELVEGEPLDRLIVPGGMPLATIFDITIPLADALAVAHDKGVVHRDLKPGNVMVTRDGRVKVLDFGLAKLAGTGGGGPSPDDVTVSAPLTGRGMILGTVPYMSPEQMKGKPVDHRSDIFSLGTMLYEMASGMRPFTGEDSATVMSAILRDAPRPLHELKSLLPRHLGRIIEHCLQKDPEHRYQSAKDIRNELRALREELGSGRELNEPMPVASSTPAALPSAPSSTPSGSTLAVPAKRGELWIGVGVIAVVILCVGLWIKQSWVLETGALPETFKPDNRQQVTARLAILPFRDNSPEPENWLASGLADLVSMRLGRINPSRLGVLGPESTAYFAQRDKSIQDLGEDLNVAFVLRGSIQTIGNDVRITASLIHADDLTVIWSEEFKGTMDDSFALQSMVAERIIAGLPVELTGEERVRWQNRFVPKRGAELAYMQGRYFAPWAGRVENQSRAISYFEQAIDIDPDYALAYCGLVDTKCFLATWGTLRTSDIRAEVMETVDRALTLDETLAEAHASAGLVATFVNWDWAAAEAAFERAIELNPNMARTFDDYGRLLAIVGRYADAEKQYRHAIDLNPVSSSHLSGLGVLYAGLGRLDEAEALLQKALEFDKTNPEASVWLADVRQKQGRFDDAVEIMERAVSSVDHPELAMRGFLGIAYAMAGRTADARKQLAAMRKSKDAVPGHHVWFAELHAALGEKDEAFRRLDQAFAAREAWLPHVRFDPGTVSIRSDPRFAELHGKMGLGHVDLSVSAPPPKKTRLAILPFKDNSPEPQQWLASGMADAIGTRLGRVNPAKLGVLGPETTSYYAKQGRSIQQLSKELSVDCVLRGSIQTIGHDVRIIADLIRGDDLTSIWSDEFKGTVDDPFALQSIVAEKIIADLPLELTGEERGRFKARYVPNPEAEVAYMRGLFFGQQEAGSEENLLRAVSYYEQAIEIDPDYALPYCGLVDAKCFLATWGRLRTSQIRSEMEQTVATALALDDTLPEPQVSAGIVATYLKWDWPEAETAFKRAIEINPNLAPAYLEYGQFLTIVGRYDEAQEQYEEAKRLDPVSSWHYAGLGKLYAGLGRLSEAEPLFIRALELNEKNPDAIFWLADVRQKQGRFDEAVEIIERAVFLNEQPEIATRAFLGNAYAMAGRIDDARAQLTKMQDSELAGHHMWFAELHAALGEVGEAFHRLEQALEAREAWLPHIRLDPGLIHIRSDPRFAELHRKLGLGQVDLSYATTAP